jgi:hypothetical protein
MSLSSSLRVSRQQQDKNKALDLQLKAIDSEIQELTSRAISGEERGRLNELYRDYLRVLKERWNLTV